MEINNKNILIVTLLALASFAFIFIFIFGYLNKINVASDLKNIDQNQDLEDDFSIYVTTALNQELVLASPIDYTEDRITKKRFGQYISPQNSPVENEKFEGFHTGVDFETDDEEGKDVPVYAICQGYILESKFISGYGGLIAQSCEIKGEPVIVLYGHVDISYELGVDIGEQVLAGQKITILAEEGKNTDGGRKHLHLSIRRGEEIDYRGYVETEKELNGWLNFEEYLLK
jgi:murein DD-endopeptidase MepM/ murein hydrolase activator NlpD